MHACIKKRRRIRFQLLIIITCMHLILPPMLTLPKPELRARRLTGRPAVDLRPWNGATEVADEAITVGAMARLGSICLLLLVLLTNKEKIEEAGLLELMSPL